VLKSGEPTVTDAELVREVIMPASDIPCISAVRADSYQ
jgi:hypothetical protein